MKHVKDVENIRCKCASGKQRLIMLFEVGANIPVIHAEFLKWGYEPESFSNGGGYTVHAIKKHAAVKATKLPVKLAKAEKTVTRKPKPKQPTKSKGWWSRLFGG